MRRLACAIILIYAAVLSGCGGSNPNNQPDVSRVTRRAFVSNQSSGALDIINETTDTIDPHRILTDSGPTVMSLSPDKTITLVFSSGTNRLDAVSNSGEAVLATLSLGDESISFFYLPDNKIVYAAVRNRSEVVRWDTSASTNPTKTITVANARRMVRSGDGKHILVFPDDASNTVFYIDTTVDTPVAVPVGGFDRPVWAVFSSDGTKAFVMNCGPECGGATAGVQVLNIPALTPGGFAPVPGGATYGLLDGSTLYVAGTPPGNFCSAPNDSIHCGFLTKVDVGSGVPAPGQSFEISDGYHSHMLMAPNNRLFVGAELTCAAVAPHGCLSIFNTGSNTVVTVAPCGSECNSLNDITGMANVTGRNVVYVVEGGELRIYDTASDALTSRQVDTVGRSYDVVSPD